MRWNTCRPNLGCGDLRNDPCGHAREKQIQAINSFKERYRKQFNQPLPSSCRRPLWRCNGPQSFNFSGCATDLYDPLENVHDETRLMIQLWVVQYPLGPIPARGRFSGDQRAGSVNALRFITKNVLLFWWKKIKFTDWSGQYWLCRLLNPWSEPERPNSRPFSHEAGVDRIAGRILDATAPNAGASGRLVFACASMDVPNEEECPSGKALSAAISRSLMREIWRN